MKNVLIVDDEKEITSSLSDYLTEKGFKVSTFNAADEAYAYTQCNKPDLILSDIKMPGKSGIDLYRQCAAAQVGKEKVPFVLMTGYSDILGVENAFQMGVSELIAKPFDLESLYLVLNYLLDMDGAVGSKSEKYFAVPIEEFISTRSTSFDIFLKVVEKFVLVTKSGQEFTEQRLQNFANKGATHIYLKSDDFAKYTDLQFALANNINKRPIDVVRKTKVMNHLLSSVSQSFLATSIEPKIFSSAMNAFEAYTQLALSNAQLNSVMGHLLASSPSVVEKSALRAMIISMVAGQWKWTTPKIQSRVILSALMCDVSLKDHPNLLSKKRFEYSTGEKNEYEQHPLESFRILSQVDDMPEEISLVALQHHENMAGIGFPQKLVKNKLHSYSKIVNCIDEFIEVLFAQKNHGDIQGALDSLYNAQGKMLSEQVIKTLYIIFKLKVPKSLEGVLLPDQTARLN